MKRLVLALGCFLVAARAEARPTDLVGGGLWTYAAGDTVEHYDTTHFRIFFTRTGTNAVPSADADLDGLPDHVTQVGQLYEDVLAFYTSRGFLAPLSDAAIANNGGDGRFDVYLLDFAGKADGAFERDTCSGGTCIGYMVQENDFVGYAYPSATIGNRILSSHEFFHAVQAAYSADQDSVVSEGTAVWATEQFDSSLNDFENFIDGFFAMADHSIDRPGTGPVPAFSYGAAIFFQFLGEHISPDVIRTMWEDVRPGARGIDQQTWVAALVALLPRDYASSFEDAFTQFSIWNLFTLNRADPTRSYAKGADYPSVKITNGTLPYEDTTMRVFYASSQVTGFDPAGRSQLVVEVLPAAGLTADSLASLRVVVAPVKSGTVGTVTTRAGTEPSSVIDVSGATQILVSLVNTASMGESTRGVVCIGSPDEAAACKAKHAPATPVDPMTPSGEGGCAMLPRPREASWLAGVLVAVCLVLSRRRLAT